MEEQREMKRELGLLKDKWAKGEDEKAVLKGRMNAMEKKHREEMETGRRPKEEQAKKSRNNKGIMNKENVKAAANYKTEQAVESADMGEEMNKLRRQVAMYRC